MQNPMISNTIVSIALLLCANTSIADTSTSVNCSGNGSASAYSRSGESVSYSSVNCLRNSEQNSAIPSGIAISKTYSPEPYTSLVLAGALNTVVKNNDENSITISGDSNDVESVEVNSSTGVLVIRRPNSGNGNLDMVVMAPSLQELKISGAGSAKIYGDFPHNLLVKKSGASNVNIEGQSNYLELHLSGAGSTTARNFKTNKIEINASGAGSISVCAKESVVGSLSGAIHLKVYCNPFQRSVNTLGASHVSYR